MSNLFLAKSKTNFQKEETIQEHTIKLINQYKNIKKIYSNIKYINWEILRLACLYHDLGKMNTKFQNKLGCKLKDEIKEIKEIPHGFLSPSFLPKEKLKEEYSDEEMRVLYQSIYYHHTRDKIENSENLRIIIKEDLNKYKDSFVFNEIENITKLYPSYSKYVKERINSIDDNKNTFYQYVITKGLLNKIDYAASSYIDVEIKNNDLLEKTEKSITSKGFELNDLQKYMLEHTEKNNIIIASTGIGKTEASLLWIGNNKGFFTLPLKVSINAIYDRVIDKVDFANTALLHSETYSQYLQKSENHEVDETYYKKTKQMSMPLTICTIDQLIDFVFKCEGFELKLATLAYSKLIIDEIQMYSPELLGYLLLSLKYVNDAGGKFSIVTATLPNILIDFMKELDIDFNMPQKPFIKENLNTKKPQVRHRMKVLEENIDTKDIINNYENKKILIIVNTVKKSQELFNNLKEVLPYDNINLLHSRFIKKDRKIKEDNIFKMGQLDTKETGIWVTTQVVEASLDIDFDVLYTELSEVSGLFQRMGRAYRNRELDINSENIFVYVGDKVRPSGIRKGDKSIVDVDVFELSKKAILKYSGKIVQEIDKMKIVSEVYSKESLKESNYYNRIKETIDHFKDIKEFDLKKDENRLRDIQSESIIPLSTYKENKNYIEDLKHKYQNSQTRADRESIKDEILKFVVDLPSHQIKNNQNLYDYIILNKYTKLKIMDFDYSFDVGITYKNNKEEFNESIQFM